MTPRGIALLVVQSVTVAIAIWGLMYSLLVIMDVMFTGGGCANGTR